MKAWEIVRLSDRPALAEEAAQWFHGKWGIPLGAYRESIARSIAQPGGVPLWLVALSGGQIAGGLGVIDNDFHRRPDLTPNICAVYVEPAFRHGDGYGDQDFRFSEIRRKGRPAGYALRAE